MPSLSVLLMWLRVVVVELPQAHEDDHRSARATRGRRSC